MTSCSVQFTSSIWPHRDSKYLHLLENQETRLSLIAQQSSPLPLLRIRGPDDNRQTQGNNLAGDGNLPEVHVADLINV
jgi:hypothetical protein